MNRQQLVNEVQQVRKQKLIIDARQHQLEALHSVISELDTQENRQNVTFTSDTILGIIKKEQSKFYESANVYLNKDEDKFRYYTQCGDYLDTFLPKMIDESEYVNIFNNIYSSGDKMGDIMKKAKKKYKQLIDYKKFSNIVKEKLI